MIGRYLFQNFKSFSIHLAKTSKMVKPRKPKANKNPKPDDDCKVSSSNCLLNNIY